jgi:hypothetical protein
MPEIIAVLIGLALAWLYQNFLAGAGGSTPSTSGGGGTLTASQIAQYAQTAGFDGNDLVTAVAIALAESGGNPSAYNGGTSDVPETSYGLMQINTLANPQYASDNLYDPQTNLNDAYEIYSSQGFQPWSTFTSGAYTSFITTAQIGVQAEAA